MCGITGFVGKGSSENLEKMVSAVRHRGPDDCGIFFDERLGIGLGHTRLAILDLTGAGHQPMWSADKQAAIVFNGEIYNFASLREELKNTGKYDFVSQTDTEVIISLYLEYGTDCFKKMEGMFAVAIYDFAKKKLVLARDRLGKKPLYYGQYQDSFIFGSELKSLVLHPSFKNEIDFSSVNKYLQFDYIPSPFTIWKDVRKLEPGCYLVLEMGVILKSSFWQPVFDDKIPSFEEAKATLDKMLSEAVANRLVADVPIGIFLSGGLDSSAIAFYARKMSAAPIETFSIGFTEASFDESRKARQVAEFLGTKHHESILTGEDSLAIIPKILDALDEPLADASIIPTFLLSKFARERVIVALGGDGGDELFAGYPTFQADILARVYSLFPKFIRRHLIEPLVRSLPASSSNFSFDFKLKKFIDGFNAPKSYRHQVWLGSFGQAEREKIFRPEIWKELSNNNVFENLDRYESEYRFAEMGNRSLYQYQKTYLVDEVMVKVDRASMLASLETRSPLLDYRLVDFVNSLPYSYKLHGYTTKYLFKELMKDRLPANIVQAKKKGFGMPVAEWLRGPLRPLMEDLLSEENIEKIGLFNYEYIAKLKSAHLSGQEDRRKELWNLIVLMYWFRTWKK